MSYDYDVAPYQHRLKVTRHLGSEFPHCYSQSDFECITDCGKTVQIDLLVSGDLPEDTNPIELIGKTVEVDWSYGYIFIGQGVRIID